MERLKTAFVMRCHCWSSDRSSRVGNTGVTLTACLRPQGFGRFPLARAGELGDGRVGGFCRMPTRPEMTALIFCSFSWPAFLLIMLSLMVNS